MKTDDLSTLLAIVVAAHRSNNRDLERQMRQRLVSDHGVRVSFVRRRQALDAPRPPHDATVHPPAPEDDQQS